MSFDLDDIENINLHLPQIKHLSKNENRSILSRCNSITEAYSDLLSETGRSSYSSLRRPCEELQGIFKGIASQNNIEKIVEADSLLVSMSSQYENLRGISSAYANNVADFFRQADALSNVLKFFEYFKTYDDYVKIMDTTTKGGKNLEKYGLPEDNVWHNLNNNILSLRNSLKLNRGPAVLDNLTDTRIQALTRAKILYMQRQIHFMIEYATKNPDENLARSFILNRARIENNVQTLLDKSDEVLGIQRDKEQSQNQTQQTQEPASNKKAKSSPDLER